MKYKIVIDSCGELPEKLKKKEEFESAPLTLDVDGEEIVDDATFDQASFLKKIDASPKCPKSACPSPDYYKRAYECGADHIYAITLSSELSGSYNSAVLGMNLHMEKHPDAKMHVFNSKSASVGESLIALKIYEMEEQGIAFETIVEEVEAYIEEQHTYFTLENLDTLRKNGRLSTVKAIAASVLKIKPVLGSTPEGTIQQLDQARGINKALMKMVDYIVNEAVDTKNKVLGISFCNCPDRAAIVRDAILERIEVKDVLMLDTAGVSSMYANDGGIIVVI